LTNLQDTIDYNLLRRSTYGNPKYINFNNHRQITISSASDKPRTLDTETGCVKACDNETVITQVFANNDDLTKKNLDKTQNIDDGDKHSIILIGDSHIRGCADKIKENLTKIFEVIGFVNLGTNNSILSNNLNSSIQLTNKDIVVFWGELVILKKIPMLD
jgi:cellulose synthase/poly-beta-1,6-N-acetylglucosamine synthase-like glycosyltransferase